ncbi:MAG: DUF5667 domain-containing protein [Candidatus Shapirobacteria bacterium]|jgi:hypothetical protein
MKLSRMAYMVVSLLLGVVILVVSMARAGLEIMAVEGNEETLRNDPIKFVIVNDEFEKEEYFYKLPEAGMLPTNPFYGFKKVRDFLWVKFSSGSIKKAKVQLLVADKRMAEAKILLEDNRSKVGLEASQEAFDALKLAEISISGVQEETDDSRQMQSRIFKAGFAYMQILKTSENSFELDTSKYNQLIKELDEWNQKQKSQEKEDEG